MIYILPECKVKFSEKMRYASSMGQLPLKNDISSPLKLANFIAYMGLKQPLKF